MQLSYHKLLVGLITLTFLQAQAQDKPAYQLFDAKGKKVKYKKMLSQLEDADILLFGESHDNPISHWLQLEVTTELAKKRSLMLGAEMIEADNQNELNDYLIDSISSKELDSLARLWPNYKTDYKPLVDFAKGNELPFIATNVPKRYAKLVHKGRIEGLDTLKGGFEALDTLSDEEKSWIAPLPIDFDPDIKTYKDILEMMGEHGTPEIVKAQALKDATMSYFILKNYKSGDLFIHYNGTFHSDEYEGILWHMKRINDQPKYMTISTVSQGDVNKLETENLGKADFIICVDSNMTTTY